jgi:hypothetical protein
VLGVSMTVRKSSPHPHPHPPRTTQSEIDRRAIGVACHLLVAAIWLERQLGNTPKILTSWAVGRSSSSPATPVSCASALSVTRPMNEAATSDPAPTAVNSSSDAPHNTRMTFNRPIVTQESGRK